MIEGASPQQELCLHLISSLVTVFTAPSQRTTALSLIKDNLPAIGGERFADLRAAAQAMLRADTSLQWALATNDAGAALAALHKAESCRLIAGLSSKRVV